MLCEIPWRSPFRFVSPSIVSPYIVAQFQNYYLACRSRPLPARVIFSLLPRTHSKWRAGVVSVCEFPARGAKQLSAPVKFSPFPHIRKRRYEMRRVWPKLSGLLELTPSRMSSSITTSLCPHKAVVKRRSTTVILLVRVEVFPPEW